MALTKETQGTLLKMSSFIGW